VFEEPPNLTYSPPWRALIGAFSDSFMSLNDFKYFRYPSKSVLQLVNKFVSGVDGKTIV